MRLTMRAAERFQRALDGEPAETPELDELLATTRVLASAPTSALAPREEFVLALRERLMAEADALPARSRASAQTAASQRAAARSPVVIDLGRGLPRVLAGAAASVLMVGTVVGVASRNAIPGSALYPVKGWLDGVAVQMAGSDHERGLTYLSQAQEHISDARTLDEQGVREADPYVQALRAATASVRSGQRALNTAYDATGNAQSLIAIRDFSARALPQAEALRAEVPAPALPALQELRGLLEDTESSSARRLAACAPTCPDGSPAAGPSALPSLPDTSTTSAAGAGSASAGTTLEPPVTVPSAAVTAQPPGGLPGVTAGPGGATVGGGSGGGGATLTPGGGAVPGPTLTASLPVRPPVTATLPSVGISTGGAGVTLPGNTLGGITLPGSGITVTLPRLP